MTRFSTNLAVQYAELATELNFNYIFDCGVIFIQMMALIVIGAKI